MRGIVFYLFPEGPNLEGLGEACDANLRFGIINTDLEN